LLGRLHLRQGRTTDAIQSIKVSLWSEDTAAGRIALAEAFLAADDAASARPELDRALELDPTSSAARALRAKIKG
jgi:Tfp pilus assembly protein PilF